MGDMETAIGFPLPARQEAVTAALLDVRVNLPNMTHSNLFITLRYILAQMISFSPRHKLTVFALTLHVGNSPPYNSVNNVDI